MSPANDNKITRLQLSTGTGDKLQMRERMKPRHGQQRGRGTRQQLAAAGGEAGGRDNLAEIVSAARETARPNEGDSAPHCGGDRT